MNIGRCMSSVVRTNNASSTAFYDYLTSYCLLCSVWVKGISNIDTEPFLGLDSAPILPRLKEYIRSHADAFAVLSELGLSTVSSAIIGAYQSGSPPPNIRWLYEQYCRYAIRIFDFGEKPAQYRIPLLEATVVLGRDRGPTYELSKFLPEPTSTFRLIIFPQTRCSFIEDEVQKILCPSNLV